MVSSISSPSSSTNFRHVRSISLPSRSHSSSTLQLEEEIAHLKSFEPSSSSSSSSIPTIDTVCGSLSRLERLYAYVNDLLSLPQTQRALSGRKDDKFVEELLDRSVMLLDICGSIKDVMEQVKEHLRCVQSALRRKKESLNCNSFSQGKMKDARRSILALKQMDNKIKAIGVLDLEGHLSSVIRSLRDTSALSASIFGSLLLLNSTFVSKPKSTRWSVVSNLIHKEKRVSIDNPHMSNEDLESHIEVIENSLESMFRTLIKTRVSLLNILSH